MGQNIDELVKVATSKHIVSLKQLSQIHPAFTEDFLRDMFSKMNYVDEYRGLATSVYKIGKKYHVDLKGFERWLQDEMSLANKRVY